MTSAGILRLKNTFNLLPESVKEQYKALADIFSREDDFKNYKDIISKNTSALPAPIIFTSATHAIDKAPGNPEEQEKVLHDEVIGPLVDMVNGMTAIIPASTPQAIDLGLESPLSEDDLYKRSIAIEPRRSGSVSQPQATSQQVAAKQPLPSSDSPPPSGPTIFDLAKLRVGSANLSKEGALSLLPKGLRTILQKTRLYDQIKVKEDGVPYSDVQELLQAIDNPPPSSELIKKFGKLGIPEEKMAKHIRYVKDMIYFNQIESPVIRELFINTLQAGSEPRKKFGSTKELIKKLNDAINSGNYEVVLSVSKEFGITDLGDIMTLGYFNAIRLVDRMFSEKRGGVKVLFDRAEQKALAEITEKEKEDLKNCIACAQVLAQVGDADAKKLLDRAEKLFQKLRLMPFGESKPMANVNDELGKIILAYAAIRGTALAHDIYI